MKKNTATVIILIILVLLISLAPLFLMRGAEFSGSDDAGSDMVAEVTGGEYEPWLSPVLESLIGGELSGEAETPLFCVQTGIGVGVIAWCFGYLAARKKYSASRTPQPDAEKTPS